MAHTKRIAAGYGKKPKFITTVMPGPHKKNESLPLLYVVRDILNLAKNAREAKYIIHSGKILVDKKPRKEHRYGVGFMDVVEIPLISKFYRVLPSKKGLYLKEISEEEANYKPLRIMNKTVVKKGKIQLNLHDGSNILLSQDEAKEYSTKDTVIVKLPGRKIEKLIKFKEGNYAMIAKGEHSGYVGKIKSYIPGTKTRKSLTTVDNVQTLTDYIFVIGEEKPEISV